MFLAQNCNIIVLQMITKSIMRSVLSISLSEEKKKEIAKRAKKAGKTVSEYILYTIDLEEDLISEDELVEMMEKAEDEYKKGKTKVLKSLADLT